MYDPMLLFSGVIAVVTNLIVDRSDSRSDRGAVSIEQVLWYAAAAISVAVVAAIIWNQIRDTASTPVQSPSAP
jgi:predicted PurR-regulated permease PerM